MADEHVSVTTGTLTSGTPPVTATTIPIDDIRRYQVIKKLGNGAHGIVMKARDTVTEGLVAIKFTYQ
jgi:serine/threonine protein kinase